MKPSSKQAESGWSGSADRTQAGSKVSFLSRAFRSSPSQIWKSRLSWRIALAVFLTILTVQGAILMVTVKNYEQARLDELVESARSAMLPLMKENMATFLSSPIQPEDGHRLTNTTRINGMAIYSRVDLNLLAKFGAPVTIMLTDSQRIPRSYRSADGSFYEAVLMPRDLSRPYYIVVQLDSSQIKGQVKAYVEQTILIMLLMSAFVTTVLMIALGHWLLEPILFLRDNLLRASENPENPRINESPYDKEDEIGGAISLTQNLIRQNADNISRIKTAAEDQIHRLAYYDSLTGLPNRTLFLQNLNEQARKAASEKNGSRIAIITMDIDHFKDINDSMGHSIGDALLRAIGKRLRASLPESAVVARSGEDEFAITMPLSVDAITARDIAERVAGVIRAEPFRIFNENFQIRSSIGVATYPDDGGDPDHVLKNADIALNRAKEDGRDTIKEYSEDFDRAVQQRFQMLRDLRDAMDQNQLLLYFQPQLDLRSGKVIGAEGLLRWWKPDSSKEGGYFIPPGDFVPVAEQSGLIVPIGEMVLELACKQAADWHKAGHDLRIAVNVSGAQFYQTDIVSYVEKVLKETGLPPQRLELEVTESVFMEDVNHAIQTLQNLHSLGCELAIDDFGTGYSSLSYLRQFPIDRLKIDQSFIRNALNNPDDAAIARTIVSLGHAMNLKVIAEGVETRDHEKFLIEQGCDEVQGYRYSRPVPGDKFKAFIESYKGDLKVFN
ncbi:MAG TPA: EAL domain-containing protein [Patescibacteria group bacterium]|nr:EAL domain-containing protein [Patescibacteria group bacterium]